MSYVSVYERRALGKHERGAYCARDFEAPPFWSHGCCAGERKKTARRVFLCAFSHQTWGVRGEAERSFESIEEKSGQIDSALRNRVAAQSISCWFWTVITRVIVIVKARARAYFCCSNSTPFDLSELSWERMTVLYVSGMK